MQQNENIRFWEQYEKNINWIRLSVILVELILVFTRIYIMKKPSFICLLSMMLIMLLLFMNQKAETQRQAKIYIILNLLIMVLQLLNFLASFSTTEDYKILYEQEFQSKLKQTYYPVELIIRIFFLLAAWRVYEYSMLKHLHRQQFQFFQSHEQN